MIYFMCKACILIHTNYYIYLLFLLFLVLRLIVLEQMALHTNEDDVLQDIDVHRRQ